MTKRFCDVCERPLTPEDDKPFIREYTSKVPTDSKVVVSLVVTNEHLHQVSDVCNKCKIKVVNEGRPYVAPQIATLQKTPTLTPMPAPFKESSTSFEPSKPANKPQPQPVS
jgi:hypothetical protein